VKFSAAQFLLALCLVAASPLAAQPGASIPSSADLPAPTAFLARDRPGDGGKAVLLTWKDPAGLPPGISFEVRRASPPAYEWTTLAVVPAGAERYVDATPSDQTVYRYELRAVAREDSAAGPDTASVAAGDTTSAGTAAVAPPAAPLYGPAAVSDPVRSHDNWFRIERTNSFIAMVLFTVLVLGSIQMARSGKPLYIRRIAGLNAVDEAIGRATELGRKVIFVPGIQSVSDIQTIAALAILGHVARASARYGTDLDCPNRDPFTFVSARETVRSAFLAEGRPDLFREEMVNYVTYDQFAYTAAVSGRMVRERPAANFLIGHFFAESLILAETGQSTGAIQIAGTADPSQLPFFVASCDYTLIGEELYAAGAYLSREPVLLGSIRGQDIAKALLLLFGLVGIVAATLGNSWFATVLRTQ
jgi:hypothetical protein